MTWESVPGAVDQVAALLRGSGTPLEVRVAKIAATFCEEHHKPPEIYLSNERIVYRAENSETVRELDRSISLYMEVPVNDTLGLQLVFRVAIECKHRDGMELFAFPYEEMAQQLRVSILSGAVGSELLSTLDHAHGFPLLQTVPQSEVTLLKIEDGQTPRGRINERLVYNAAASIYDFIGATTAVLAAEYGQAFRSTDLWRRFLAFREANRELDLRVMEKSFADSLTDSDYEAFAPDAQVFDLVEFPVPVLCVSAPIHSVALSDAGEYQGSTDVPILKVGARLSNWPGEHYRVVASHGPEALLLVTNPDGLTALLEAVLGWATDVRVALEQSDDRLATRFWLQGALHQAISLEFGQPPGPIHSELLF